MSEREVTASMVKELRERTGVGMTKCKEALDEAKGDIEEAIAILRKKGIASAVKKEGRETKEGVIVSKETHDVVAIAEINAETDFVVKNDRFKQYAQEVIDEIAMTKPQSLDAFLQQKYSKDPSLTNDQHRSLIVQTIGENIQIKRFLLLPKSKDHSIGMYSHLGGKILTCVELRGSQQEALAKDIGMHIAACSPEYVNSQDVPKDLIEKEREIARGQVQGKPANIIEKIIDGKLGAYFDGICLLRQKFVKDDSLTIQDLVKKQAQAVGEDLEVLRFIRWAVGS